MITKVATACATAIHSKRNWIVLVILSIGMFGAMAYYDAPGALAVWLSDDLNIKPTKLGLLYSGMLYYFLSNCNNNLTILLAYSGPTIVFALFCGYLLDKFGISVFLCIYQFLTVVAAGMLAFSYTRPEGIAFIIMIVSRAIGGISGDGLAIASRRAVV